MVTTSKIGQNNIQDRPKSTIGSSGADVAASSTHKLYLADTNYISHHSAWECDFRQIDPGRATTSVIIRASPRVALVEFNFDRSFHQVGCSPTDCITFGLPVTPTIHSWRGAKIDIPGFVNFGMGSEFDCVTGPGFIGLGVSISTPLLARVSGQLGLSLPDELLRRTMLPVRRRTPALLQLTETARVVLHRDCTPFGDRQQEDLVAGLISAATDSEEFDDRSAFSARARAVTQAVDLMQVSLSDGLSIGKLCVESGASLRTLSRGFQERFGIGPKAYFNQLRLVRVRSDLMRKSITYSVADAANNWGYWHMGQFAKDYHRMFGELPSETLNGAKN
jgi:AraC family ethanolamine operon transcriptional activator